jgi:TRAP-type C4-dicarboxylate transport system permease small subunit
MRRFLDRLYDGAGALAALSVFLIFLLMIWAGVGRQLNWRVSGVNDVVAWLCAAASFLAMAHAFRHGDFVRVTLLLEKLPAVARRTAEVVCLLIALVSVGYLTWWATAFTWESYEFAEMATGLVVIPIWIPQTVFVVGCWLFLVALIDELVGVLRGHTPSYQRAVEERHAAGDFSSDI